MDSLGRNRDFGSLTGKTVIWDSWRAHHAPCHASGKQQLEERKIERERERENKKKEREERERKEKKTAGGCSGLTFFSNSTPEWRVAGELLLVWSNNSMHSRNDELPKPPWEKQGICAGSGFSMSCGFSVASWYSGSNPSSNLSASLGST